MASTPFASALKRHDQRVLREAFEACNTTGGSSYNRTTLTRWLDRSIPRNREFVECLTFRLEDPSLLEAWEEARRTATHGAGTVESAVNRFRVLSVEERAAAFPQIRELFLEQYTSIRSRFNMRIDLYDHEGDADLYDLRLVIRWTGRLPENANVAFVFEQADLGDAFTTEDCIFRDDLGMDQATLDRLLDGGEQILSYKPLDEDNPMVTTIGAVPEGNGVFRFDNDRVDKAEIRLDLRYPYQGGRREYPIRFGQYQVKGMAEVVFALHSKSASSPKCMPFLPPGQDRAWASSVLPRNELMVYLGTDDTLLSEGDGLVLSWT